MIAATAGHVDHGKTSLVKALTGVDTDRLPEERRRGMSIELGFAYLPVEGALAVGFVDVPGHERFVANMAAGIHAVDRGLLVVAADDGCMPQTREHLEVLRLRGVPQLLVALTKVDRVPAARRDEVAREIGELLARTEYAGAAVVPVSARTGEGIAELREQLVAEARRQGRRGRDERPFRMHVDRAFVLEGVGVVVTGTALTGRVAAGDRLAVLPSGRSARVRGLRVHDREAAAAFAGERCALVLQGVRRDEVARGDVLAAGSRWPVSRRIDVRLRLPRRGWPRAGKRADVHVLAGTASLPAALALLGPPDMHALGLARITFAREASLWHGDRLLLRDPGTGRLLGGADVIDPLGPERGAARPERLALLARLHVADAAQALDALLAQAGGCVDPEWLARAWHLDDEALGRLLSRHALRPFAGRRSWMVAQASWEALRDAVAEAVGEHHARQPEAAGPSLADLRERFAEAFRTGMLAAVLAERVRDGGLLRAGAHYRLPSHAPALSAADEALWMRLAPLLAADGAKPPRVHELSEALALEPKAVEAFLSRAALAGRVLRIARNRFVLPPTLDRMVEHARALDAASDGAGFTAAQYRDRSGLGRNLAIEVLEYLDAAGYTWRRGERRRVAGHEDTEGKRTPVGRPDFKPGERRATPLAGSTPAPSANA